MSLRVLSRSFLVCGFLVIVAWPVAAAEDAPPGPRPAAAPAGAPADWWEQVQRSILLEEYGVVACGAAGAEYCAANPAQRFDSRFDRSGLVLNGRDEAGWECGLSLTSWGRPGSLRKTVGGNPSAREDRVGIDREVLREWFVNRPGGLEHGLLVPMRPEGGTAPLVIDLALSGGLRPVLAEDGQAVDFYGKGNVAVLRYAQLRGNDAAGAALPARMEAIGGGLRITVEDAGAVYPVTVDSLATTSAWTAVGEATNDYYGASVSSAGDVNGDGHADVIVGAYGRNNSAGKAYLYLGGPGGLATTPAWTAVGEAAGHRFGASVATAGDVNGDGYADVVVGAHAISVSPGKAYLYLGGPGGLAATAAWTAVGEATLNAFGWSVAAAGDVNGDGYADVVVGAYGYSSFTGKAYLYLGGPGGLATTAAWTAVGEVTNDLFGFSVATGGDVNGDGYADVVVGAYGNGTFAGKAYLYMGGPGGLATGAAWSRTGPTGGRFGQSVATAGDVNGDGHADVIVGAYSNDGYRGHAYLYLGGPGGLAFTPAWTAAGEAADDRFGFSVATAGDVNGDGHADVVVGAYGASAEIGKAYLYLGGPGGLAGAPTWTGLGEAIGNRFGQSVATAGDVNGDGYADVIVGALQFSTFTGKAYLYLGGPGNLTTTAAWTAAGEAMNDRLGHSVATAGDVNGDGHADVIVGADGNNSGTGKAYLYLGGPGGLATTAAWTAVGEAMSARFGGSVATAGDVNGDGYADVIVGAYGNSGSTGKTYLYLGGPGGLAFIPAWTAAGEAMNDRFGSSVATAGDANGDGHADVIVGADGNNGDTGKAYLYVGGPGGLATIEGWTAVGEATSDRFGSSVATGGDVNGDGYADVIVGAHGNSSSTGEAYLYLGGPGGLATTPAWTRAGETVADHFGDSVATAGDINGDGYSDVIVGASRNNADAGKAYLYVGGPGGLSTTAAWTAVGEATDNGFGASVATGGDVNGDGYADVIVGAHGNSSSTGKAYLYLGGPGGLATAAAWATAGEATTNYFGFSVATAADINGDGYADAIVGAFGNTSATGKAYLYFGNAGPGVPVRPRQLRSDQSASICPGGLAYQQQFRLGLTLGSPMGAAGRRLQWQVRPWGGPFTPTLAPIQTDDFWYQSSEEVTKLIALSADNRRYVWRARVQYHPAQSPFTGYSRWVTLSGNSLSEADLVSTSRAAPPPCVAPDEAIYITNVTLDGNSKPVLHYQDPNQPSAVTGYNIYRSSDPQGPWALRGSNVVDMDEGTPNNQYVDLTGDVGSPWFYKVAAWNDVCGAEGPL